MALTLSAAVYTADHGYAWSVPVTNLLDALLADALATRPDFADEAATSAGVAVRDSVAAAFTIRRASHWDAEGRDSDYAAFAFVPCDAAAAVDFAALLAHDFFATPTHTPPATLTYDGPASAAFPVDAPGRLLCHNRIDDFDPHALGTLLARYGSKADKWLLQIPTTNRQPPLSLTTSPWHR